MSETVENPTTPTRTAEVRERRESSRLNQVLAWVGIVAGVVFIVAVVFFSGFFLGRHSGAGYGHLGGHDGRGIMFHHRGGPHMGPMGRWPGGQMGPGSSMSPSSPTNTPSAPSPSAIPTPPR